MFAFSVGLNMGLHGFLSIDHFSSKDVVLARNHRYIVPIDGEAASAINTTVSSELTPGFITTSTFNVGENERLVTVLPTKEDIGGYENQELEASANLAATVNNAPKILSALESLRNIYADKSLQDLLMSAWSRSVQLETDVTNKGDIELYLEAGHSIPIVLMTCNRADQLKRTITSLLAVRGVVKENIIVSQDGSMQEVRGTLL